MNKTELFWFLVRLMPKCCTFEVRRACLRDAVEVVVFYGDGLYACQAVFCIADEMLYRCGLESFHYAVPRLLDDAIYKIADMQTKAGRDISALLPHIRRSR